ncbi:MAG: hypothetical protein AABW53_01690 [Nanoarchaeota archaeon]
MFRTKKGQSAAGAAVLIAIIAALIIFFVILIPQKDREKLLEEETDTTPTVPGVTGKNLLTASPGRIDYLAQKEVEHPLPVINIYTQTEAKVLAEKNVAYAKKGVFSEKADTLTVMIPDLQHTENVLLSLGVEESEGKLIVSFNGEEVFNAEVSIGSLAPVSVPKNLLKEENLITFTVSSPGLAFWSTNEVTLRKVQVVADVTSVEAQSSKNVFLVSEVEKKNMEKVVLKFQPGCKMDEVGTLSILINGKIIYSGVPDCDLMTVPLEFSPETLNQGENEIIFKTEEGAYLLTRAMIESKLKEIDFPSYYFELSYEEYRKVVEGDNRVKITLDFVDVVALKLGDIVFNGHARYFDTKEVSYALDVSDEVVQGANSLKIKPRKTLEVRELSADLVE